VTAIAGRRRARPARQIFPASGAIAFSTLGLIGSMALFPALFTGLDPLATDVSAILRAPSWEHIFGTDQVGRDVYTRVVYGAGYSLGVGFGATVIALGVGLMIGTVAGLVPRALDGVLMRGVEIVMAFPEFLVALFVIAVLGPGPANVIIAVSVAAVPAYIRVARAETLVVRRAGFVEAATGLGVHPVWITLRHIVPNTLAPLSVIATIGIGTAIVAAAGLSFLGLGPQDPTPEWGLILAGGRNLLAVAWWIAVFPGLFITATVISATVLGRRLGTQGSGGLR
jgi:peptide/nickel transport system permease protein